MSKKNVRAELTPEEWDEFTKRKGNKTTRRLLLESVGMDVEPRKTGRPTAEEALRRQNEKWRTDVRREIHDRMVASTRDFTSDEATKITCPRCGTSWVTRLEGPRQIVCHICGHSITIRGPGTKPVEQLAAVVPDEATDALRRTNELNRLKAEDGQRRKTYANVDRDHAEAVKKMTEGSFKFEKKKRG